MIDQQQIDVVANIAFADALATEADQPEGQFYEDLDVFSTPGIRLDHASQEFVRPPSYDELARTILRHFWTLPSWRPLWDLCDELGREQMLCDAFYHTTGAGVGFLDRQYPDMRLARKLAEESRGFRRENLPPEFVRRLDEPNALKEGA